MKKVNIKLLKGNGDFRSDECREILKDADIVVTNPPFSLIRELFSILKEEKKQYILMGCLLNVYYDDIAAEIIAGECRLGRSIRNKTLLFRYGNEERKMTSIEWLTNLHEWYPAPLPLTATYSPEKYPKYDDIDAIEVSRTKDIPKDYYGVIGVPISFIDKWCPQQFEVLGKCGPYLKGKRLFARFLIKRRQNGLKNAK